MRRAKTSLLRGTAAEDAIVALCEAGLDAGELRSRLRGPLSALLAFDGYCVNTCDPANGAVTSSVGDGLPEAGARRLFALEARGDDFNCLSELFGSRKAVVTLSAATAGEVSRSARMREVLGPLGFRDELRAALRSNGACWGYLHLLRKQRDFDEAEVARVRRVLPAVGEALRVAAGQPVRASPRPAPAVLLFDDESRVVETVERFVTPSPALRAPSPVGEGSSRALRAQTPVGEGSSRALRAQTLVGEGGVDAIAVGGSTPHAAHAVAARARGEGHSTSTGRALDGQWLTFHAARRKNGVAVVVTPAAAEDVLSRQLAAVGLTARQQQVARMIVAGASNEAIAARLKITLHTAKDHVKAVLARMGLERRSQLASTVL